MTVELGPGDMGSPVDLATVTGIRLHGDEGVTPVDRATVCIVRAGGETWLRWTHQEVIRAANLRHIIEVFSDTDQLPAQ